MIVSRVSAVLAQFPNDSGTPTGPEFGKASPVGLVLILLLLVGVVLLVRSMNKRLKQLPDTFDQDSPQADQAVDDGTDRTALDDPDSDADTAADDGIGDAEGRDASTSDAGNSTDTPRKPDK